MLISSNANAISGISKSKNHVCTEIHNNNPPHGSIINSTDVNVFIYVGVYGDSIVHIIWESYNEPNINEFVLESSIDGINFTPLAGAMISSLSDFHANNYPAETPYFDNILMSTEHGHARYLYNETVKNQNISANPKWYRIQMITPSGNIYTSQVEGTIPTIKNLPVNPNSNSTQPITNPVAMKNELKAGCTPLGTPTAGYVATTTTQTYYGQCCYWVETLFTANTPVQTNCGGNSYAWCCTNVPEASGCSSGNASDPCCIHYCTDYYACTCQPWQCCTSALVTEWVVTQSVDLPPISLTANIVDETCNYSEDGSISIIVNNGTGPFSYLWSNGATTSTISGLDDGDYDVTVTDANNCTSTGTYEIEPGQTVIANAGNNQTICPGTSTNLNASGGVIYQWSTGFPGSSITVSPNSATTYIVTVTSSIGCTAIASTMVSLYPNPVVAVNSNIQNFCNGNSAILSANSNIPGTSYLWDDGTTAANRIVSPTATSSYSVTGTSPVGCINDTLHLITVYSNPVLSLTPISPAVCIGSSTVINVNSNIGGTTYFWNNGQSGNSITVSPSVNTIYTITGTSPIGCSSSNTILVNVLPLPIANAGTNTSICIGNSTQLVGSGGALYNWSNGINSPTNIVNPITTTSYILTVTDFNGCQNTDDITILVNPLPNAEAGSPQIICNGQSANLTAYGGVAYSWSNGLNSQSVNVSPTMNTSYFVTVTDINGCSSTDNVLISVNQLPISNAGNNQSICLGSSAILNASGGIYYLWNNNAGSSQSVVVSPQVQTTYIVTVTDQNGCTSSDNVIVSIYQLPQANAGIDHAICFGNGTSLSATGGVYYYWNNGSNTSSVNINPSTTTTYSVTVTDQNGCTDFDDVTITVNPLPIAIASPDQTVCYGTTTTISANGGIYYLWSGGLGNGQQVTIQPTITSSFVVTVTDMNGCSSSDNLTINVNPLPQANAGPDQIICNGSNAFLSASGGVIYQWNNGSITSNITVNPNTTTTYLVNVTDNNGCSANDEITINVNPTPTIICGPSNPSICLGEQIYLSVNGANSYSWSPPTGLSAVIGNTVSANPTGNISYNIIGTDINGCIGSTSVNLTVNPLPVANFSSIDFEACQMSPIEFTDHSSTDVVSYLWDFGDATVGANNTSTEQNPSHIFQNAGIFEILLEVTNGYGCKSTFTNPNLITIHPKPTANFNMTSNIVSIENPVIYFFDNSVNANTWNWNFGDPSTGSQNISSTQATLHEFSVPGTYNVWLYVETDFGCKDSIMKEITKDVDFTFYIPSAFTPNGDGKNDFFFPKGTGYDPSQFEMIIFDRWGEILYETSDITKPWDGRKQGHSAISQIGVYVYQIYASEMDGDRHKYIGTVSIAK